MLRRSSCGGDQLLRRCKREQRDWAGLPSELTEQIASRLLQCDVTEYLRFRAACKAWRTCTEEPRSLKGCFRPRRWIMLSDSDGVRRRFLNLTTGDCAHVDLPELSSHHFEGSTEGLLVLRDKGSDAIRLLDPFTRSLVEFPPATSVLESVRILKTCISDETFPPSVALFLIGYGCMWNIAYAKPGDERWSLVDEKCWVQYPSDPRVLREKHARRLRYVRYNSAVTLRGRIYFSTHHGNILMLRLHPRPRMVPLIKDQATFEFYGNASSYLVHADDDGKNMLMVRFHETLRHLQLMPDNVLRRMKRRKDTSLFKLRSEVSPDSYDWYQLEVFQVDIKKKMLVPVQDGIGERAVFLGSQMCVSLSSRVFPSVYGDAVYLGMNSPCSTPAGVRRLNNGTRAEPRLELVLENNGGKAPLRGHKWSQRVVPPARPYSIEEYLVGYVSYRGGIKD